jgi:hypothetical protein
MYVPLVSLNIDVRGALIQMEHLTKQLDEKEIKLAISRSINRTLTHIRAKLVKEIPKVYTVKGFQVRDRFEFEKSNRNTLTGKVKGVSNRISASNFDNTYTKGGITTKITRSKKAGMVTKSKPSRKADSLVLKVYRGQPGKKVYSTFLMNRGGAQFFAFRGKYKKTGEYQKAQFGGRKIKGLLTQSVWDMAMNDGVQLPTSADGMAFFLKRFEAEANNLIRLKPQIP